MVTNPEIKKVLIISDKGYALKADGRDGGVGTETQIISKEIYDGESRGKFVAVVTEKDEKGKPFLPTYYKSRIYIDLSNSHKYAENFEQLLRWVFDKPIYSKPELGKIPAFLNESLKIELGTSFLQKRLLNAIKEKKPNSDGALLEYLNLLSKNIEKFRIKEYSGEFDDAVIENIELFLPYRNEYIQILIVLAQYGVSEEYISAIHKFFESLIQYYEKPKSISSYRDWDFDNLKFLIHELFLYTIAILIKYEKFERASFLLDNKYYNEINIEFGRDIMSTYSFFWCHLDSLRYRNERLKLRKLSVRADLLKKRSEASGIDFIYLMQADFIIYFRAELHNKDYYGWRPETLLYLGFFHRPFEIFARAQSLKYFNKIKCLLKIETKEELDNIIKEFDEYKRKTPNWEFETFNPKALIGYDKLCTEK